MCYFGVLLLFLWPVITSCFFCCSVVVTLINHGSLSSSFLFVYKMFTLKFHTENIFISEVRFFFLLFFYLHLLLYNVCFLFSHSFLNID